MNNTDTDTLDDKESDNILEFTEDIDADLYNDCIEELLNIRYNDDNLDELLNDDLQMELDDRYKNFSLYNEKIYLLCEELDKIKENKNKLNKDELIKIVDINMICCKNLMKIRDINDVDLYRYILSKLVVKYGDYKNSLVRNNYDNILIPFMISVLTFGVYYLS